jgi:hypothetical protein
MLMTNSPALLSIDLATSLRIITTTDAAAFLGMTRQSINRKVKSHSVWKKYFWYEGKECRTSLLLLGIMELELVGLATPGDKIIQSFISTLRKAA